MASEAGPVVIEVPEPMEQASVSRFLKNRTAKHADSDYHPTHDKEALADLPDLIEDRRNSIEDKDRDVLDIPMPESQISEEEISRLKQETSHLPFDTVLKVLAHYHFNVPITIAAAQQMGTPDFMGEGVQRIFTANVVYEREKNPTRTRAVKEFYLASSLRKQCDTKALVDFYYQQKNRIGTNWRMENDDGDAPLTSEQRVELQGKMLSGGLRWCRREHQNGPYKGRSKRGFALKRAHNLRRDHAQIPGCSKDLRPMDDVDSSDAVSVASSCPSQKATTSEKVENLKLNINEIPVGESAASPAAASEAPVAAPEATTPEIAISSDSEEATPPEPLKILAPDGTSPAEPSSESSSSTTSSTSTTTTTTTSFPQMPKFRFNINFTDLPRPDAPVSPITSSSSSSGSSTSASTSTTPVKNSEGVGKIKKTYKKKTIEELRGGPQKTYPDRERRPRKIFE